MESRVATPTTMEISHWTLLSWSALNWSPSKIKIWRVIITYMCVKHKLNIFLSIVKHEKILFHQCAPTTGSHFVRRGDYRLIVRG